VNLFLAIHSENLYNTFSMNASMIKIFLVLFFILMVLVAFSYLSQRKMKRIAYALWGIFALLLPGIGPFFLIAYRPGDWDRKKCSDRIRARQKRFQQKR